MATINVKDAAGATVAVEKPLTPGQSPMATSRPVAIASDQSDLPVKPGSTEVKVTAATIGTGGVGYLGWLSTIANYLAGTLTVATHAVTQSGSWVISAGSALIGKVTINDGTNSATVKAASTAPLATDPALVVAISPNGQNLNGSALDANSAPVAQSTEMKAAMGSITETAPASDTASSGHNGRLQRIAQRITSLIALFPAALGSGGGLKVDDIFGQYETVAASSTTQAMGATGAAGDYLAYVEVFPGTAGCGVVTILDNATVWGTFAGGGTTALPSLVPFRIDVGAYSTSGAWKITTGANVTAVGVGKFT